MAFAVGLPPRVDAHPNGIVLAVGMFPLWRADGGPSRTCEVASTIVSVTGASERPFCIYCGHVETTDVTPASALRKERWFMCGHCSRSFAVVCPPVSRPMSPDRGGQAFRAVVRVLGLSVHTQD